MTLRPPTALGLALCALIVPARARAAAPLPKPADGWAVELVAEAPRILYPTAVVAAPDGTVYLGQDPMDMPGPPNVPADSVVAIRDGRITTFADGLWAVMGLEYVEGTLYVVHAPVLSAFRDTDGDGRADAHTDLMTGLGPEVPGFSGINDHVASGIRMGMDGFLYISVGDKGIPEGVGKDGAKIRLHGGGVIRIRPDGSGLEVVSTGERNPLSVALTAADEIFTYGNDDDSKKWPNSLTHHVVGGHYGYPYEFLNHPERCLPVVAGQVGGSGAQGLCYNEAGLPAGYRGNLFFCDWGLQTVFRYQVERKGGTFKVVEKQPFVTAGDVADFRPFSLAVTPDGAGFYLVDWAYNGWLAQGPRTGRLYRLKYAGPDAVAAPPGPEGDDGAALVAALDHPALSVRLVAQRKLSARGPAVVPTLVARLNDGGAATGRIHALWALDALGTPPARAAIRNVLADADPGVRLQAARSIGIRKDKPSLRPLVARLRDPEAAVRREAAIALGRLGDRAAGPALMEALGDPDTFAAWSIRRAIRDLGAWDQAGLVSALLDPGRREAALRLTDEAWAVPVVRALGASLVKLDDPKARARVVANLAGQFRRYPEWSGRWFGTNPLAGDPPVKTQPWDERGMAQVARGLEIGLRDADAAVRGRAIAGLRIVGPAATPALRDRLRTEADPANLADLARTLGMFGDAAASPMLAALVQDGRRPVEVRTAALDALGSFRDRAAATARIAVAYDKAAPPELVARAVTVLGRRGILPPNDLAGFLDHPEPAVRAAALMALAYARDLPDYLADSIVARLDDPDPDARKAAVAAVAQQQARPAVPKLLELAQGDALRTEAALALASMPDPRALPVYLAALGDPSPELRRSAESALLAIRDEVASDLAARVRAGEFKGLTAMAVERVLTTFRPVVSWRVIGPFARTTPPIFLGEPSLDFSRPQTGAGGGPIAWHDRPGDPQSGRVVFDDFKAGGGDRGGFGYDTNGSPDLAAFAFAEVTSEADRDALLLIGSSGSLIVTLNEQVVFNYDNFAGRPYAPDADVVPVTLKAGVNRLLVRTRQGIGTWSFSVQVSEPSGPDLLAPRPSGSPLDALREYALAHDGDPERGEAIFFDAKGVGCATCHAAAGRGSATAGPDLTGLASKYDRTEIIRSVLEPSARIATGYQPLLVATSDGRVVSGLLKSEDESSLELIGSDAKAVRVPRAEVAERRVGDVSIMPAGLADALTPEQFADLIAYLRGLKATPATAGPNPEPQVP